MLVVVQFDLALRPSVTNTGPVRSGSRTLRPGFNIVFVGPDRAKAFAHTAPPGHPWEPLPTHLQRVAQKASEFTAAFGASDWGHLLGLWHDLGKYSDEFQDYLRSSATEDLHEAEVRGSVDHSTAGAQHAAASFPSGHGQLMAYVIAGHHAGLPDWEAAGTSASLIERLRKPVAAWATNCPPSLLARPCPSAPSLKAPDPRDPIQASFRVAFWVRMLFSALCDADFLATEQFMSPDRAVERSESRPNLAAMREALDEHTRTIVQSAAPTTVNQIRASVLEQCRAAASVRPGFFELQVPTGGGKTLSSLMFSLDHAIAHGLRRVVVAVPFTTIIEQTAEVYRKVFASLGDDVVLEHHSGIDPDRESVRARLQSENWDSDLIVTTTVQLYESLFASRPSRCRKLHRLSRSVIILDEVQSLPVDLLDPTLRALRELVECYGCTVVLCSATLPAVMKRPNFTIGLDSVHRVIEKPEELHRSLRRCKIEVRGTIADVELSSELRTASSVLCIVNTRRHARALSTSLGTDSGHFHLSTRMCPAHRLQTFERIRNRLQSGKVCRVVSTQLVEAGVDLDFEAVFRARCGLDSLAQAAGRCNREGLRKSGRVVFFAPVDPPPLGYLRETVNVAEQVIGEFEDLLSPAAIEAYFTLLLWRRSDRWDARGVIGCLPRTPRFPEFLFREMERRYRMIPDSTVDVIIPWGREGKRILNVFKTSEVPSRRTLRRLQRFVVSVFTHELKRLEQRGALQRVHDRWALADPTLYSDDFGLDVDPLGPSPREDTLII